MRVVIDATNLMYISMHSYAKHSNSPYPVIEGMLYKIIDIAERISPDLYFAFDSEIIFKQIIYQKHYKTDRHKNESEEELRTRKEAYKQLVEFRRAILPTLGANKRVLFKTGFEADDHIGNIVKAYPNQFTMASTDRDLYQLLDYGDLYNPVSKAKFNKSDFIAKFGINPRDWPKVKAIAGKSGEIKGINGVGEIGACKYVLGQAPRKVYAKIKSEEALVKRNIALSVIPFKEMPFPELSKSNRLSYSGWQEVLSKYFPKLIHSGEADLVEKLFRIRRRS